MCLIDKTISVGIVVISAVVAAAAQAVVGATAAPTVKTATQDGPQQIVNVVARHSRTFD